MSLFFRISGESEADAAAFERTVDEYVGRTAVDTDADLAVAIETVLAHLSGDGSIATKKRGLIQALGEGAISPGLSKDRIIASYVRPSTFYNKQKSWLHDPTFRWCAETAVKLYRKWDSGRAARDLARRQQEWRDTAYGKAMQLTTAVDQLLVSAAQITSQPLYEQEVDTETGTIKLVPGKWTRDTANRNVDAAAKAMTVADKLARLSLDMPDSPTESHLIVADVSNERGDTSGIEAHNASRIDERNATRRDVILQKAYQRMMESAQAVGDDDGAEDDDL